MAASTPSLWTSAWVERTSHKVKIINNIFYDCGEADIVFPTDNNVAAGNL